jgi:hypothetical protein
MRIRSGLIAALTVSFAMLGACAREPMESAWVDEQIPPEAGMAEPIELAGGPSEATQGAAHQAEDDAYIAHLASRGLIAERRIDPDTGRSVLVISNRPVPNPVLFGGPERRRPRVAQSGRKAGRYESPRPAYAPRTVSQAAPSGQAAAPTTTPAPTVAAAAPAPAPVGVAPAPADPVQVADPAQAGFRMTPAVWGIIGAALLALLALLFFANRPKKRTRYSSHQAPPEASGGGEAHA